LINRSKIFEMKLFFKVLVAVVIIVNVFQSMRVNAQSFEKMSYQAVIRNSNNALVINTSVGMQISILQGSANGTVVYSETQNTKTNINGLVSIEIGAGISNGTFSQIDWTNTPFFIKTETDPTGGTNYTITGTSQLLSVPFAFHATTADSLTKPIVETDPVFSAWDKSSGISITESQISDLKHFTTADETDPAFNSSVAKGISQTDTSSWNNKSEFDGNYKSLTNQPVIPSKTSELANDAGFITDSRDADADSSNELQVLLISNDTLYLSKGGFVKLPKGFSGNYADLTNIPSGISAFTNDAGYQKVADDGDTDPENELQYIYKSGNKIGISDGGYVTITETDPIFSGSQAANITATDITKLSHLSGTNTGDQNLSGLATKTALTDTAAQIRSYIHHNWLSNGNDIYYPLGKVGIGTSDPSSLNLATLNVEGGVRYTGGSGYTTPGLLFYDPTDNGTFKYFDNSNTPQVLGTGSINYTGTLWTQSSGDLLSGYDVICQSSLAVGMDAVPGESFGFATIILKENNTRIKFDDTSASAGFPANDWQLTANESASGGANYFAIEDLTGLKIPFKVMAGAPTNALFVSSVGKLGINTGTPVLDIHINKSDTPAIRLEQNASGGFTAQTWDVAGNEANFFVRDVTGGSSLPFRIRPGAPTSSIDISTSGNVGIGTASPARKLHVQGIMRLEPTTEPIDPGKGDLYFDSTSNKLRCYDGTEWHDLW